jgi:hypothetical protein
VILCYYVWINLLGYYVWIKLVGYLLGFSIFCYIIVFFRISCFGTKLELIFLFKMNVYSIRINHICQVQICNPSFHSKVIVPLTKMYMKIFTTLNQCQPWGGFNCIFLFWNWMVNIHNITPKCGIYYFTYYYVCDNLGHTILLRDYVVKLDLWLMPLVIIPIIIIHAIGHVTFILWWILSL